MDVQQLISLMQLTDSGLPTGAFSHSLGFETYLYRGQIEDAAGFAQWLEMFTALQLTFTDAVAVRCVHDAGSFEDVRRLDRMMAAQALPRQVREGSSTMGRRMLVIGSTGLDDAWVQHYREGVERAEMFGHPATVMGVLSRAMGVTAEEAVAAHLFSTVLSLTQNAVRAIPLGQNAGQQIIRDARSWVVDAVDRSRGLTLEDLGAITPGLEIAQMAHERQRARLFMS